MKRNDLHIIPGIDEYIIRDYLHIFLIEIKRIIHRVDAIVDNSAEYILLRQFFLLVNNRYPLVRTVEYVAGSLGVTPARLWLAVSEIADLLNFKEKSQPATCGIRLILKNKYFNLWKI